MDYRIMFLSMNPGFFERERMNYMDEHEVYAELAMDLSKTEPIAVPFTPQEGITFGLFRGDIETVKEAVAKVDDNWVQYFNEHSEVYCGFDGDKIVSFCNVGDWGVHDGVRVGGPGCVGTIPEYRERGIGLEMVRQATELLKDRGVEVSWIHFTHIENWYKKLGYETVLKWNRYGIIEEKTDGTC
ncbi:MAG: GNAT family N-acetyltransferase [Lachnospiraceae bacterium]|nr:GNAT family N-acetyltransferase [Lachnospiraceae bacterium]